MKGSEIEDGFFCSDKGKRESSTLLVICRLFIFSLGGYIEGDKMKGETDG